METAKLKKFAQFARRSLIEQVAAKLNLVLAEGSAAWREQPKAIAELEKQLQEHEREQVVERIAYTWFNRFCALRFMDVNRYTRIGVVSPAEGQFQPEILAEAKMGHIDEEMVPEKIRQQIFALLAGSVPSRDPQAEAYRLLVVAACNDYHRVMPYLFERIADFTELLMPDDLLSENSILAYTRATMIQDVCGDVEVIGWLYQFYISEKKDKVFDDLKKNKKITPENIPAATQLFTPHWIVRYLVENSLGRLWMLNRPNSKLIEQMEYYIRPVVSNQWLVTSKEGENLHSDTAPRNHQTGHSPLSTDHLRISSPEEIRICDTACGSGHMLTYAFDLLYAIYEEEGYEPSEIPEKILTHNLYGIEIDERAGELAAFALTMKARTRQRRFFRKPIQPNICVLQNVQFDDVELKEVVSDQWLVASGASREDILHDLNLFEEADNFGSLLRPRLTSDQCTKLQNYLTGHWSLTTNHSLFESTTHQKVLQALQQADYLSPKYHVVIANPPYMGGKGMNPRLSTWVKENYPDSKSDLFAMFIERNLDLAQKHGALGMITMQSWMFLSSFEKLREKLLDNATILSMAHLGARGFDSIGGEVVSTTAFVLGQGYIPDYKGAFVRLVDGKSEAEKDRMLKEAIQ
jgi:Eco57I restriction-modification methylase